MRIISLGKRTCNFECPNEVIPASLHPRQLNVSDQRPIRTLIRSDMRFADSPPNRPRAIRSKTDFFLLHNSLATLGCQKRNNTSDAAFRTNEYNIPDIDFKARPMIRIVMSQPRRTSETWQIQNTSRNSTTVPTHGMHGAIKMPAFPSTFRTRSSTNPARRG